jgi:dienelactone hydrolase
MTTHMKKIFPLWIVFFLSTPVHAALVTKVVGYKHGKTDLEGYVVYDDAVTGKRPGVIVVHEWMGHNAYARFRADELAKLGYVAFAIDMYGKGVLAKDHEEAGKLSGAIKEDRKLMRARAKAALDYFAKHPQVRSDKIAAIGYCFGGTTVLEMARAGFSLKGVASFHGALDTPKPEDTRKPKAKIIVFQGADDNFTSSAIPTFEAEMKKSKADWQMVTYGSAVHSFTVADAGTDPKKGMAYNAAADQRSWQALISFLAEVFS